MFCYCCCWSATVPVLGFTSWLYFYLQSYCISKLQAFCRITSSKILFETVVDFFLQVVGHRILTMLREVACLLLLQASVSFALYSQDDDVIQLTDSNFQSKVVDSDSLWLVEFYAPWCGHCQNLVPAWKQAASNLVGIVNVGAVDVEQNKQLGGKYQIQGFPTIKVFGFNKNSPTDYQGGRTADDITNAAMKALRDMVADKKSGGKKSGSSGGSGRQSGGGGGGGSDVVTLTDANFKELVLEGKETWLVEFYAPWCGHCKNLAPQWERAATEVKEKSEGQVKLGALDATVHQSTASRYGIRGYPTIKIFKQGAKETPIDYDGPRDASGIASRALEFYDENIEPPTIDEIINQEVFDEKCGTKLCVISFVPDILDSGKSGRNEYLDLLKSLGEKYKKQKWGWAWAPAMAQAELEKTFRVGGAGYPAVIALNKRKELFALHTGAFSDDNLSPFLNVLTYGRGKMNTYPIPEGKIPEIKTTEPWDGEDGTPIVEEEVDLSDFKWDDEL